MEHASWQETWTTFERHRDDVVAAARSVLHGSGLAREDALDLVHAFVIERLPGVVAVLRDLPDSRRGPYLRAAMRNFARDAQRRDRAYVRALQHLSQIAPQAVAPEEIPDDSLRASVVNVADALTATAARLYFGVDGPPHSIREVANSLTVSRHTARRTVLDGVLLAAVRLGQTGFLSAQDVEACRAVLDHGLSPSEAAETLNLNPSQVRAALNRARETLARNLRSDQ